MAWNEGLGIRRPIFDALQFDASWARRRGARPVIAEFPFWVPRQFGCLGSFPRLVACFPNVEAAARDPARDPALAISWKPSLIHVGGGAIQCR